MTDKRTPDRFWLVFTADGQGRYCSLHEPKIGESVVRVEALDGVVWMIPFHNVAAVGYYERAAALELPTYEATWLRFSQPEQEGDEA